MALFKPFKGKRSNLDAVTKKEGNAYFCVDDGSFHIDYVDANGALQRKQINAKDAETLAGVTVDDILADAVAYTDTQIAAIPTPDVSGQINTHNNSDTAHSDIRTLANNAQTTADQAKVAASGAQTTADDAQTSIDSHAANKSNPHGVTAAQVGSPTTAQFTAHAGDKENPHDVTYAQVGADKAGAAEAVQGNLDTHTTNKSNPHGVTVVQIGAVPTTRTVNGKALSSNISLSASDVGADVSGAAADALEDANAYTDSQVALLLNNSSAAVDSVMELAAVMETNSDAIEALEQIAASKAASADLNAHTTNKSNPHGVTCAQIGADVAGAADAVQTNLDTHISNVANPHGVTKAQVGLGNVPNVTTNDQTPTYTAASTLATLTSGEKLSISMGKIMKAITDLISHIGNKSNPHEVSLSQLGVTATAAELNTLDGITATTAELNYVDGVTSAIQTQLNGKSPTSHASTATTYGIGTGSNYGHVKLSDSTSSTSAASAGIAASPAAVKAAYDLANTAKTNAATAQTTADTHIADSSAHTDTKVTSVENHYTPSADSDAALSVDASSTTSATWGSTDLVTGVNIQRDAKGHVTGVTVDSIQMPSNPNTDTHWTATLVNGATATATANAAASNGSVYLNLIENGSVRNAHKIVGSGTTTVSAAADGTITISSADSKTGTVTGVTAGNGLTGGGTSGAVTLNIGAGTGISVAADTVGLETCGTAGTYGPTANVSGSNGATIKVPQITTDAYGRVTSIVERTYTSVDTDTNTDTKNTAGSTNSTSKMYLIGATSQAANPQTYSNSAVYATDGSLYATAVYGAVWNDYAEYRCTDSYVEPGRVVIEVGDDTMTMSSERMQPGASIVSDTFGFAIGETETCKTPVAVSGRVLVYPFEDRYIFNPGDAVCTGPNGTVSKMTREEIREYPERIVGVVSAIPEYKIWGTGNVEVNGRIWVKVK